MPAQDKPISPAKMVELELGSVGLHRNGGQVSEEILRELTGSTGAKIFRQMEDNDPTIGALLFSISMIIRSLKWKMSPTDDKDPEAVANAEFADSCMHDMSETWADTISSILSFLVYGFSVHEQVFKLRNGDKPKDFYKKSKHDDGRIGWKRLPIRSQLSILNGDWLFAEDSDDLIGISQLAPPRYKRETIPMSKLLLFRTINNKNNPEGKSILRNAYRPWHFKRNVENIEAIGIERELAGLPVFKAPAQIMAKDAEPAQRSMYSSIKDMVVNVRNDEQAGLVIPSDRDEHGHPLYELSLLSCNGAKMFDTNKTIERYRNEILSTVIADFITLGQGVAGTQALADTKVDLFLNAIESWVKQIEAVFNRFAITHLFKLNGITEKVPTLKATAIKKSDVDQTVKNISMLAQSGMELFPSPVIDAYIRDELNMPLRTKEEDELFSKIREQEAEKAKPLAPSGGGDKGPETDSSEDAR